LPSKLKTLPLRRSDRRPAPTSISRGRPREAGHDHSSAMVRSSCAGIQVLPSGSGGAPWAATPRPTWIAATPGAPGERPDDEEEDQRDGQPRKVAAGDDPGDHCDRQKQECSRPQPPGPGMLRPLALRLPTWEVGDQLVQLGVGLRRHAALEPGLQLVGVEAAFQVALPQDLADRVALLVAD